MAQFQERHYHPDTTEKRTLCARDVAFLAGLQKELNTQPNMGNADPLFWMIIQTEEHPTAEDYADGSVAVDPDTGETAARSLQELADMLDNGEVEGVEGCGYFNGSCNIRFDDGETAQAFGLEDAVDILSDHGVSRFEIRYVRNTEEVVKDTLFLTHKDCEQHLESYGYNYKPDAHAYAMTAIRSPRYEQLIRLIRTVDWGSLPISGGSL